MCGIIVVIGDNSKEKAEKILKKIIHRGNDNIQIKTINNISFGFTRLAINDKSSNANQPFIYNNNLSVVNGEIYNHKSLKNKYDICTKSYSDIEILLPLYEKNEEHILEILDGFYSGVIYDNKKNKLIFVRDYIGKKPLFFAYDKNTQYITSELLALPKIEGFEIIPKGMSMLEDKKIIQIRKHIPKILPKPSNIKLYNMIENSVFKRIIDIKNTKIGIFLSGGLDSSIIAVIASKLFPDTKIHYYSILDEKHSDYKYVKIMHKFMRISSDEFSLIKLPNEKELIKILEQVVYHTQSYNPSIISNGICSYILSKKAKKDGVKVVLTGDGADEMFMGYDLPILKKKNSYINIQESLIKNLHTTELRRIDSTSMANTIEIRCPFLDKSIYDIINTLSNEDYFGDCEYSLNKNIIRKIFKKDLPFKVVNRKKESLDVGSGLQKMLVDLCKKSNITEEKYYKKIWNRFFEKTLSKVADDKYFSSYPAFDDVIKNRANKYTKIGIS
jgi:asparagine synthase (glutamine-hydrolysing)